ncbi:unnamed protein product, partial [Meganyctiphanes norvegica]
MCSENSGSRRVVHNFVSGVASRRGGTVVMIWCKYTSTSMSSYLDRWERLMRDPDDARVWKALDWKVSWTRAKLFMLFKPLSGTSWSSERKIINKKVNLLVQFCKKYGMVINEKKTKLMVINGSPIDKEPIIALHSRFINKNSDLPFAIKKRVFDACLLSAILYGYAWLETGKVERTTVAEGSEGVKLYRAVTSFLPTPMIMSVPCGVCPLITQCDDVGDITPLKCEYMKDWLEKWN